MAKKKKYGWVIHYTDGDMTYEDNMMEPFDSYEEAEESAQYADSCRHLGADMLHLSDPYEKPDTSEDIEHGDIEIFEIE